MDRSPLPDELWQANRRGGFTQAELPRSNGRFWHLGVELMFEAFGRRLWVCSNPKLNVYVQSYHCALSKDEYLLFLTFRLRTTLSNHLLGGYSSFAFMSLIESRAVSYLLERK